MTKVRLISILSGVALVAGLATATFADSENPPANRERRDPPAVAFTACEHTREGDTCNFVGRNDRKVKGTCRKPPNQDRLVCRPTERPNPPARGDDRSAPPREK